MLNGVTVAESDDTVVVEGTHSFRRRVGRRGEEIRDERRAQAAEGGRREVGRRGQGIVPGRRGPRLRVTEGRDEALAGVLPELGRDAGGGGGDQPPRPPGPPARGGRAAAGLLRPLPRVARRLRRVPRLAEGLRRGDLRRPATESPGLGPRGLEGRPLTL